MPLGLVPETTSSVSSNQFTPLFPLSDEIYSVTGCINVSTLDRLNPDDGGGQYDSNGGDNGTGNPEGSVCTGYVYRNTSPLYKLTYSLAAYTVTAAMLRLSNLLRTAPAFGAALIHLTAPLLSVYPHALVSP